VSRLDCGALLDLPRMSMLRDHLFPRHRPSHDYGIDLKGIESARRLRKMAITAHTDQ